MNLEPSRINESRSLRLYGSVARHYELLHHVQTLWADTLHRKLVASRAQLDSASTCLDIGCGTGLSIIELAQLYPELQITGLDASSEMLDVAHTNLARLGLLGRIHLIEGRAEAMPFEGQSFDAVTSTYGLGGVAHIDEAISEVSRILVPGGVACFGEMSAPPDSSSRLARWIHKRLVEPWIRHLWEFRDLDLHVLLREVGFLVELSEYHRHRLLGSMTLVKARKPV